MLTEVVEEGLYGGRRQMTGMNGHKRRRRDYGGEVVIIRHQKQKQMGQASSIFHCPWMNIRFAVLGFACNKTTAMALIGSHRWQGAS